MSILQLPSLYESLLNHPSTSDELRRATESKQLRNKQKYLHSIPATKEKLPLKQRISSEVDELVDGIILLRKPDELGWNIFFESRDCEDMSQCPLYLYPLSLFPEISLKADMTMHMCETTLDCSQIQPWLLFSRAISHINGSHY
jgi:hypothetical protein